MRGGVGDEVYIADNTGDIVEENAGEGTDIVQAANTYTLGAHIENLTLTGSASINGTGNGTANTIIGNIGNNILEGLAGADTIDGGTGTDTASYAASLESVSVSLATGLGSGGDAAGDVLISIERLTGSSFNDVLEGNSGTNVLAGGAGIDTVSYINAAAAVTVNLSFTTAQGTGGGGSDTLTGFENLTGSTFNDTLSGNGSANVLNGISGNDTLTGNAGNDTFVFGSSFGQDIISDFAAGAGIGDVIEFHDGIFADFSALQAASTQVGAHVQIAVDASNSILLKNVALGNLNQNDFLFF
jgi:Ca2+-binding RTX toxin-like protein